MLQSKRSSRRTKMNPATVLPNELWSEVLSYLSRKELKAVRLVGDKHLETLASSRLFLTAHVAARRGILDIFMKVTTHPTIRHFIREIIYDSSWFEPPFESQQLRNGRYRVTGACLDHALAKIFQEQEQIQTKEMASCLETAFRMLTNVRKVVFADLSRTAGFLGDATDVDGYPLKHRINSGGQTKETGECCLSNPKGPACRSHQGVFRRQYGGLSMLLRAMTFSPSPVMHELKLGSGKLCSDNISCASPARWMGSDYGGIPYLCLTPIAGNLSLWNQIFVHLRKLSITLCCPDRPRWSPDPFSPPAWVRNNDLEGLRDLLIRADNLEHVKLCGHIDTGHLQFSEIFGSKRWSKLRILKLKYFDATTNDLATLFARHKDTLKYIKLDNFNLLDGAWHALETLLCPAGSNISVILGFTWQDGVPIGPPLEEEDDPEWLPFEAGKKDLTNEDVPDDGPDERPEEGPADEPNEGPDEREISAEEELEYDDDYSDVVSEGDWWL